MEKADVREKIYDTQWADAGGEALGTWGYELPLDPRELTHAEPSGSHRTRTHRRRMLRAALYQEMLTAADAVLQAEKGSARPIRHGQKQRTARKTGPSFMDAVLAYIREYALERVGQSRESLPSREGALSAAELSRYVPAVRLSASAG